MLKFFWRCESTTLDNTLDFSVSDVTANGQGPVLIDPAAARVGTNGFLAAAVGAETRYQFTPDNIVNPVTGALAISINIRSGWPAGDLDFLSFRDTAADDALRMVLDGGSTGLFEFQVESSGVVVSLFTTTPISLNTWYGVVARWDQPNHKRSLEIYDASNNLI